MIQVVSQAPENRLSRFARAQNFAVYYGCGHEQELAKFDIAIVEPLGQNTVALDQMQSTGTLVLAYLSVLEVLPDSLERKLLRKSDFISLNGQPFINQEYGNYWADLRSPGWIKLVLTKAHYLIDSRGFDGLFLDTIGYVESAELNFGLRQELIEAGVEMVRLLRTNFPEYVLVQNNGVEELCQFTAPYLNGICWENPPFRQVDAKLWTTAVLNNLLDIKEQAGLQVLLLLEDSQTAKAASHFDQTEMIAVVMGFLVYRAPEKYIGNVNLA